MNRNRWNPVEPSSVAASSTSLGTWVRPANVVKATNGTDCQVMITVATKKKLSGSISQLWPMKSRPKTVLST